VAAGSEPPRAARRRALLRAIRVFSEFFNRHQRPPQKLLTCVGVIVQADFDSFGSIANAIKRSTKFINMSKKNFISCLTVSPSEIFGVYSSSCRIHCPSEMTARAPITLRFR
jgi:hypothetical protein